MPVYIRQYAVLCLFQGVVCVKPPVSALSGNSGVTRSRMGQCCSCASTSVTHQYFAWVGVTRLLCGRSMWCCPNEAFIKPRPSSMGVPWLSLRCCFGRCSTEIVALGTAQYAKRGLHHDVTVVALSWTTPPIEGRVAVCKNSYLTLSKVVVYIGCGVCFNMSTHLITFPKHPYLPQESVNHMYV